MTGKEFIDNICKGFTVKEEGFSVKKMLAVIIVGNMIGITWAKTDLTLLVVVLSAWLAFVTSLVITGAVEKNIKAVNETKQLSNTTTDGNA